jgi:hypothetical protein
MRQWIQILRVAPAVIGVLSGAWRIPWFLALVLIVFAVIVTLGGAVLLGVGVLFWPAAQVTFWEQISTAAQVHWIGFFAAAVCLLIGFLLYLARRYMRGLYGVSEVFFGAAACWVGLSTTGPADHRSGREEALRCG